MPSLRWRSGRGVLCESAHPCRSYTQNTGARSTSLVWRFLTVEDWVKLRVVVHLHLAVELETPLTRQDLPPESIEAVGQIAALLLKDEETVLVAVAVGVGSILALCFLVGVVDLQGKDGQAVDDEAGRLGVQRSGAVLAWQGVQESFIDLLDQIVAALVEAVDGVLDGCDVFRRGAHVPGHVLLVPEVEVGAVLGENGRHEAAVGNDERLHWSFGRLERFVSFFRVVRGMIVPPVSGEIVAPDYLVSVDHSSVKREHSLQREAVEQRV